MSKARQQKHSHEIRNRILKAAARIISDVGVEALSVRSIAREMDYSAGIIYHYFSSKDEIIESVLRDRYNEIIQAITPSDTAMPADEAIQTSLTSYIENALRMPSEYNSIMQSASQKVLAFTSILAKGSQKIRPALAHLAADIEKGIISGLFRPIDAELAAQAIISAVFGLIARLNIEKGVTEEQKASLINCQVELIIRGLKA
ncbi:MAG: TetR/AcrR family transcriptional regulator [Eubacteriaceae bacterium]|jgi:AcrR family transcriptional regulator|nr:TetR/AcrR family transcriptional regulator [Eubacteriaceae bacterium]